MMAGILCSRTLECAGGSRIRLCLNIRDSSRIGSMDVRITSTIDRDTEEDVWDGMSFSCENTSICGGLFFVKRVQEAFGENLYSLACGMLRAQGVMEEVLCP